MKRTAIVLATIMATAWAAPSSHAEVNWNIHIGVPVVVGTPPPPPPPAVVEAPPVVVEAAPEMMYMPEAGIYVAVGTPYELFFINGRYFYFNSGRWYASRGGYGGPWTHVEHRSLPPGLRRNRIERIHEFRDRAWRDYRDHGPEYRGRHFRAEEGRGRGEHEGRRDRGDRGNHGERDHGRGHDRD